MNRTCDSSILRGQLQTLSGSLNFSSKVAYAFVCIRNTLALTNSTRESAKISLMAHRDMLFKVIANARNISSHNLLTILEVVNCVKQEGQLSMEERKKVMGVIENVKLQKGHISSELCNQLATFCKRGLAGQSQQIMNLLKGKMTDRQMLSWLNSLPLNQLLSCPCREVIELTAYYPLSQVMFERVLEMVHFRMVNEVGGMQTPQRVLKLILQGASNYCGSFCVLTFCSLIYSWLVDKGQAVGTSPLHLLLRDWTQVPFGRLFLRSNQKHVQHFADVVSIIESVSDLACHKDFHLMLQHYAHSPFPWRQQLQSWTTKREMEKQLLLMASDSPGSLATRNSLLREKDEIQFSEWLPVKCMRTVGGLLRKVETHGPFEALQAINWLKMIGTETHGSTQLYVLLMQKWIEHRSFESLAQIQKIVLGEVNAKMIIGKLKRQGQVNCLESSQEKTKYIILVPLLLSKSQTELQVGEEIASIFGHETLSIQLKFYVAEFMVKKMILQPLKSFVTFLLRELQSSTTLDILRQSSLSLKRLVSVNNVIKDWICTYFGQELERLLGIIFSKLNGTQAQQAITILFQIQKLGVFGETWLPAYRWVVLALEHPVSDSFALDCLQLLEVLVDKARYGLPKGLLQRLHQLFSLAWPRFSHEHFFVIERIMETINGQARLIFKQVTLSSLPEPIKPPEQFHSNTTEVGDVGKFFQSLSWNLVFGHIESAAAVRIALKAVGSLCPRLSSQAEQHQSSIVSALQMFLYVYQEAERDVDQEVDQLVSTLLQLAVVDASFKLRRIERYCLQYLSRVGHSINILKLPLGSILWRGLDEKQWVTSVTDLIDIVRESKPAAIGSFKLQPLLHDILLRLTFLEEGPTEEYLDLLEVVFSTEGDYQDFLRQNLRLLGLILYAERQLPSYRCCLVRFILGTLLDYNYVMQREDIWFLLNKYFTEGQIVELLLDFMERQGEKGSGHSQEISLLMLTYTQQTNIQTKLRKQFDTHLPPSSVELQFMKDLAEGNYAACQKVLNSISNPFGLVFSQPELNGLVEWQQAYTSAKLLLRFLYDHPDARQQLHRCQSFYLIKQYLPFLADTLTLLKKEPQLDAFLTASGQGYFTLKNNPLLKTIFQTLQSILRDKRRRPQFCSLFIDLFKNNEDAVVIWSELIVIALGNLGGVQPLTVQLFYLFCRDIVGEWELIDSVKVERLSLRQLIYIFPYPLAKLGQKSLSSQGLLCHYSSLVQMFRAVKSDIGVREYVGKVQKACGQAVSTSGRFLDSYIQLHILWEGADDLRREVSTNKQFHESHLLFLGQMLDQADRLLVTKMALHPSKIEGNTVVGYVATTLHFLSWAGALSPLSIERLTRLQASLDSYPLSQSNRTPIRDSLSWMLKKNTLPPSTTSEGKILKEFESTKIDNVCKQSKEAPMDFTEGRLTQYASMKSSAGRQVKQNQSRKETEQSYNRFKETEDLFRGKEISLYELKEKKQAVVILEDISPESVKSMQVSWVPHVGQDKDSPSEEERASNVELMHKLVCGQFSIQSLKDHCKFVSSLSELPSITSNEFMQLMISLEEITQTVQSHSFYIKKVTDYQTTFKLQLILKNLEHSGQKSEGKSLVVRVLRLFVAMAAKKEKKTGLFGDLQTIQWFKLKVKAMLNGQPSEEEASLLLQLMFACRCNTEIYFKAGLFSMVLQMAKRDISTDLVIDYLIRIELTSQLINEIYQRGLFNKLVEVVGIEPSTPHERAVLNLWVRLAGKVCISRAIQDRFKSKELHIKVWKVLRASSSSVEKLNLCYFYAYLCLKNEEVREWLKQERVLEELLGSLKGVVPNEQLYLLFYHFCFGSAGGRDYTFRIRYHLHLMHKLAEQSRSEDLHLNKYFFKSLGLMLSSKLHVATFFKEETVQRLINSYHSKTEPAIYECLLDFISTLDSDEEFDQLKRQGFWESLKLFEYKVSNEATYSYLIQIFLVMIKKGRTKEFNQAEVRSKICLKAEYSINMEGKELALRFIVALSIANRENYLTERCVKLLASIMGLKVSTNQIFLTRDLLKIEGTTKKIEFLSLFSSYNIDALVVESLPTLQPQVLAVAINILATLSLELVNNRSICEKVVSFLPTVMQSTAEASVCQEVLTLLLGLSANKENCISLAQKKVSRILQTKVFLTAVKVNNMQKDFDIIIESLNVNGVFSENELQSISEAAQKVNLDLSNSISEKGVKKVSNLAGFERAASSLRSGNKVKMYKMDGSISQLLIFISSDNLELNCGGKLSEVVKQKWRLPLNEISKVTTFEGEQSSVFLSSLFHKNSGFFSQAPRPDCCLAVEGVKTSFYICFISGEEKMIWMQNLAMVREGAECLLSKLK